MPFGRRVIEAFGGQKTVDPEFDEYEKKILALEKQCRAFTKITSSYLKSLKVFQQNAHSTAGNMMAYYEDAHDEPMRDLIAKLDTFHKDSVEAKYPLLEKHVSEKVSGAMNNINEEIIKVKERMKVRNEARLSFDHYSHKIEGLRKEKDKYVSNGQFAAWKNKDKFERNERKFESAKNEYEALNEQTIKEMKELWATRFRYVNNMCAHFIKMQMFYFSAYGKQCASFIGPMKIILSKTDTKTPPSSTADLKRPDITARTGSSPPGHVRTITRDSTTNPIKPERKKKNKKPPPMPGSAPPPMPSQGPPAKAPAPSAPPIANKNVFDDFEF
mmetsp:Transcript_24384/g.58825  ORF Transcript_24384/g.58825 Transcript_24384/m.58825 type:complete len:329 (-) Transcript_24384:248-1234(-)